MLQVHFVSKPREFIFHVIKIAKEELTKFSLPHICAKNSTLAISVCILSRVNSEEISEELSCKHGYFGCIVI